MAVFFGKRHCVIVCVLNERCSRIWDTASGQCLKTLIGKYSCCVFALFVCVWVCNTSVITVISSILLTSSIHSCLRWKAQSNVICVYCIYVVMARLHERCGAAVMQWWQMEGEKTTAGQVVLWSTAELEALYVTCNERERPACPWRRACELKKWKWPVYVCCPGGPHDCCCSAVFARWRRRYSPLLSDRWLQGSASHSSSSHLAVVLAMPANDNTFSLFA